MESRLRILCVAVALVTIATAILPVARAQSASSYDAAVSQTVSTTCGNGEPVALTGNLHFQYSVTADPGGGNRYEIAITSRFSGVGQTSQASYAGNGSYGYGFTTTDSPAQVTLQLSTPLTSEGSAPSLMLNQTVNITVDTAGNIGVSLGSASTSCAGS